MGEDACHWSARHYPHYTVEHPHKIWTSGALTWEMEGYSKCFFLFHFFRRTHELHSLHIHRDREECLAHSYLLGQLSQHHSHLTLTASAPIYQRWHFHNSVTNQSILVSVKPCDQFTSTPSLDHRWESRTSVLQSESRRVGFFRLLYGARWYLVWLLLTLIDTEPFPLPLFSPTHLFPLLLLPLRASPAVDEEPRREVKF